MANARRRVWSRVDGCQSYKRRSPGLSEWSICEPIGDTLQIDGSGGHQVLQVRFRQAEIARTAQVSSADRLRNGAFNSSTLGLSN